MKQDVVQLTKDLVAIPSASNISNAEVSDFIEAQLKSIGFTIERLTYTDQNGVTKVSLVAKLGEGTGGLGLFSHSDTVPGGQDWNPFDPVERDGRLFGRGSCDMKGPLAATMMAAAQIDATKLRKPLYIVATADEEVGYGGAYQVEKQSKIFQESWPAYGVVAEPTQMIPVYAHKGGIHVYVTAHGSAAHTSTDRGVSANFLIAPFLAEMAELVPVFKSDERFLNREFDPPTFGFNMVINDFGCKTNVTAAKTVCTLSLRTMPKVDHEAALAIIREKAQKYNLEMTLNGGGPFYVSPESEMVQMALKATDLPKAETVPFGTEALVYKAHVPQQVILGPGNIAQAHTVGEWVNVAQLAGAVAVYKRLIEMICLG